MEERKLKLLRVSTELIAATLMDGARPFRIVRDALPKDAAVFLAWLAEQGRTLVMVLESEEFAPCPVAGPIPEISPQAETIPPMEHPGGRVVSEEQYAELMKDFGKVRSGDVD